MCGCALALFLACEELYGDQSPQGPAKGPGPALGDVADVEVMPQEHL